jgi:hypothetical protein
MTSPNNYSSEKYAYLLKTENKDCEVEYYWYWFKSFVTRLDYTYEKEYFFNNNHISKELNIYQKNKEYDKIYTRIKYYIIDIVYAICKYHPLEINLMKTNIKRWNNIIDDNNKIEIFNEEIPLLQTQILIFFEILIFLKSRNVVDTDKIEEITNILSKNIEINNVFLENNIKYFIDNYYIGCLEKINFIINIREYIIKAYSLNNKINVNVFNNTSLVKIINKYVKPKTKKKD